MKTITYMVNAEGQVYSRVGSEVAIPVLDFAGMRPDNNYATNYNLEKFDVIHVAYDLNKAVGTRKIPLKIKNIHRKFWGMKPIKSS